MPPCSLTILKYAPRALPIVPYADAGPLYGLVLPILISVAVTPGVCAAAGSTPASAMVTTRANAHRILNLIVASLGRRAGSVGPLSLNSGAGSTGSTEAAGRRRCRAA